MAKLTPNSTYELNGVLINEKIIPDGTKWQNNSKATKAGFKQGDLYKSQRLISGDGTPLYVTIHNTNDLAGVYDDGEQYVRATYNENMNSSRVHFYIDDLGGWQLLKAGTGLTPNDPNKEAEVSWHAGDGVAKNGGNMTSISIELIMNDNEEHDKKAYDNAARVSAYLLDKYGLSIDDLVTHTYWVNKAEGRIFANGDEQSTSLVKGKKWCPTYIFKSTQHDIALKNWLSFKELVKTYMSNSNKTYVKTSYEEIKPWAIETIKWAKDNNVLVGDDSGNLLLDKTCTREEMLVFLHRMYKTIKE